jgi:hypothetical protein
MTKDELKAFKRMVRRFYEAGPPRPIYFASWPTVQDGMRYAFEAGLKRRKPEAK